MDAVAANTDMTLFILDNETTAMTGGQPTILPPSRIEKLVLGLGAVSLGIFLSTFARTELQILQFIPIVIVPQGLLGGFFWPIDQLPSLLQPVARILPVTYAIDGLRQVMIAGADLSSPQVLLDMGVLVAIAAIFVTLAAATIRREVA